MKNISKYILGCLALAGVTMQYSCDNAEYDVLSSQAFIAQTQTNANSSMKITVGQEAISTDVNVRLSDIADEESTYKLVADAATLEAFNEANQTPYELLPAEAFEMSSETVKVKAGSSISEAVNLTIKPFTEEMKNSGKQYALALKLEKLSGNTSLLASGSTMTYVLDRVVYQPVPVFNSGFKYTTNLGRTYTCQDWTIEFNINMSQLGQGIGQMNNQAILANCKKEGVKGQEIYIRFGDAPIDGRQFQIKHQGTQLNSHTLFEQGKWYHFAIVVSGKKLSFYVNGVLDNAIDIPGETTDIFAFELIPSPDWTRAREILLSELRIWEVARTPAEIVNNMYVCNPNTKGLIGYWKFNEGQGNVYHDCTPNKADGTSLNTPEWKQDVRIDGK